MNDMINYFIFIKQKYPEIYQDKIFEFIESLKNKKGDKLLQISILCSFEEYKSEWKDLFPEVYKKFGKSHFFVARLTTEEKHFIVDRYIKEVEKEGVKFIHAI